MTNKQMKERLEMMFMLLAAQRDEGAATILDSVFKALDERIANEVSTTHTP